MRQFIFAILALNLSLSVGAQTVKELQAQQRKLEQDIENTSQMLKQTRQSKRATTNQLNILNADIRNRKQLIHTINSEISALNTEIANLEGQRIDMIHQLDSLRADYAKLVRETHYAQMQRGPMLFLLSSPSFDALIRRARHMREFSEYRRHQVSQIEQLKSEIELKEGEVTAIKNDKTEALYIQQQQKNELSKAERKQRNTLDQLKKDEKKLQSQQREQQKKMDRINKQIEELIAKDVKKEPTMTPEEKLIAGGFEQNKGRLPWPVEKGLITGLFGTHPHPIYEHVTVNNKGIFIQTTGGADARAIYDGEVTSCVVMGSQYAIIVKHGNYRSVYTGISKPYVKTGDKVKTKQKIGRIYTDTNDGNKTEIQLQIWKDREILNPSLWIAR